MRAALTLLAELEGKGGDEDSVAFLRDGNEFRNLLLVEQPNGDYADTLMRQFFFDGWHYHQLQSLQASGMSTEQALLQINRLIDQQAFVLAVDDLFRMSSWIFLGLIALVWICHAPPRLPAAAAGGPGQGPGGNAGADAAAGAH
mgnify:CR=1 FL=1